MLNAILFFWTPTVGYLIAIFAVSALPRPAVTLETPDYLLHGLEYGLLTLLVTRLLLSPHVPWFTPSRARSRAAIWLRACLTALLLAVAYGAADEWHQTFVPGRHGSLHDLAADAVGALLACGAAALDYLWLTRCPARAARLLRTRFGRALSYASEWLKAAQNGKDAE